MCESWAVKAVARLRRRPAIHYNLAQGPRRLCIMKRTSLLYPTLSVNADYRHLSSLSVDIPTIRSSDHY